MEKTETLQEIKTLAETTPNDMEFGKKVRKLLNNLDSSK
jgi:hypothetical protein